MTTDLGLLSPKTMSRHLDRLQERRVWLIAKVDERMAIGQEEGDFSFLVSEIHALDWAIPVCEAERDSMLRLRERIGDVTR